MSSSRRPISRRGFTLVELLVVLGIITLLAGILLPMVFKARRSAEQARTGQDMQAIGQALEAFKQTTGSYPTVPWNNVAYDATSNAKITGVNDGSQTLYSALTQPFKLRPGGMAYGPFIEPSKLNATGGRVLDRNGTAIIYFPALFQPPPDLTVTPVASDVSPTATPTTTSPRPLYSRQPSSGLGLSLADMRKILGDRDGDGLINPSAATPERASFTGPFILWAAGPDKKFGFDTTGTSATPPVYRTDDVTNFEIPADYRQ